MSGYHTVTSKRKRYRRCTAIPYREGVICDGFDACYKKNIKKCICRHKYRYNRNSKPRYGDDWRKDWVVIE